MAEPTTVTCKGCGLVLRWYENACPECDWRPISIWERAHKIVKRWKAYFAQQRSA